MALLMCTLVPEAIAFRIDAASEVTIGLDTILKYSAIQRVKKVDGNMVNSSGGLLFTAGNQDDANRNFNRSIASNRFDILSELG